MAGMLQEEHPFIKMFLSVSHGSLIYNILKIENK